MRTPFDDGLEDRLARCVRIDTQSDPASTGTPSTAKQLDLARLLAEELGAMGAADVALTARGIPCPHLFTGMQEIHGPREWVSVQDMGRAVELCLALVGLWARPAGA